MISVTGLDELQQKLAGINPETRKNLLQTVANKIADNNRIRIDRQVDLSGAHFRSRSPNTEEKLANKKMLVGLQQMLSVLSVDESSAEIGFTGKAAVIATLQQVGQRVTATAAQNRSNGAEAKPATGRQAIELIRLGFTVKNRKPTTSYIMSNYTIAQAGGVINKLRTARGEAVKKSWQINTPGLKFFGVTEQELQQLIEIVTDEINRSIGE